MQPTASRIHPFHRHLVVLGIALAAIASARAQEMASREEAMRYALVAALHEPSTTQAPFKVDADLKRPVAGRDGDYGLLILPETKLTSAVIAAAGKEPIPVGQLWLRKLTPMVDGSPVDESRLTMVSVNHDGNSARLPLCLLGARKKDDGSLELLVYGKSKEPLVRVPLKKATNAQTLPIEITAERESDSGRLTFKIAGQYEATISVTELAE